MNSEIIVGALSILSGVVGVAFISVYSKPEKKWKQIWAPIVLILIGIYFCLE